MAILRSAGNARARRRATLSGVRRGGYRPDGGFPQGNRDSPKSSREATLRFGEDRPRRVLMASTTVPGFLPSTMGFRFANSFPHVPLRRIGVPGVLSVPIGDASN